MAYPDKDIPTEYTQQATTTLYANQPALATDWHDLVDNQNYVFAHKGTKFAGHVWNPPWDGSSTQYDGVSGSQDPEREDVHINLCGIPQKPIDSIGYILEIFVFGEDFKLDFDIVNVDVDPTTNIASPSVSRGDGLGWETSEESLDITDVTTDGTNTGPAGMLRIRFSQSDGPGSNGTSLHEVYIEEKVIQTSNASTRLVSTRTAPPQGPMMAYTRDRSEEEHTIAVKGNLKWNTKDLSAGQDADSQHSAATDSAGDHHIVWLLNHYRELSQDLQNTKTSNDSVGFERDGVSRNQIHLTIDNQDDPWVINHDFNNDTIDILNREGGTWSKNNDATDIGSSADFAHPRIHVEDDDRKHVIWIAEDQDFPEGSSESKSINYEKSSDASGSGASWSDSDKIIELGIASPNSSEVLVQPDLTTSTNSNLDGKTWIIWSDQNDTDTKIAKVDHTVDPPSIDTTKSGIRSPQDTQGSVYIEYEEVSGGTDQLHAIIVGAKPGSSNNNIWHGTIDAGNLGSGSLTKVSEMNYTAPDDNGNKNVWRWGGADIDEDGNAHVAYAERDSNGNAVPAYATDESGSFVTETVDDRTIEGALSLDVFR